MLSTKPATRKSAVMSAADAFGRAAALAARPVLDLLVANSHKEVMSRRRRAEDAVAHVEASVAMGLIALEYEPFGDPEICLRLGDAATSTRVASALCSGAKVLLNCSRPTHAALALQTAVSDPQKQWLSNSQGGPERR